MRGDQRSPFTPPATSKAPVILVAAAVLVVGVAVYRWHAWWPAERAVAPPAAQASQAVDPSESRGLPNTVSRPKVRPESRSAPAWVRCEANGRVRYSDGGCPVGTLRSSSTTTQAAVSTVQTAPNTAGSTTIYRCTTYSGAVFWSSAHCNHEKALVDRMVSVPRGLDFQQQVAVAEQALPRETAELAQAAQSSPSAAESHQRECQFLDERIRNLDAQARQPQSAPMQDWLREKRKQARDRQFALHC